MVDAAVPQVGSVPEGQLARIHHQADVGHEAGHDVKRDDADDPALVPPREPEPVGSLLLQRFTGDDNPRAASEESTTAQTEAW